MGEAGTHRSLSVDGLSACTQWFVEGDGSGEAVVRSAVPDATRKPGKTVVVALGGNAILQPGQVGTFEEQLFNIDGAMRRIAALVEDGWRVVLTHGNAAAPRRPRSPRSGGPPSSRRSPACRR